MFNVCFVLPLIAIEAVIVFAPGNKAEELLGRGADGSRRAGLPCSRSSLWWPACS